MRPWSEAVCDWLVDYYALTTVVLVAAVAAMGWLRQPARRLLVARSGVVGLAMLAILAALPGWPRASWRVRPARTQPVRPPIAASEPDSGIATPLPLAARIETPRAAPTGQTPPSARGGTAQEQGTSRQPAVRATAGRSVKLERCGTLTGRLVDVGGLPRAGAQMTCYRPYEGEDSRFEKGSLPSPIRTDEDGRFRVSGLKYSLRVWGSRKILGEAAKDVIIKAGETKDVGDTKVGE
jgi:hypothetical protein